MSDPKAVENSPSRGIGPLFIKSHANRYEPDDVAFSPPEEGGFISLQTDRRPSTSIPKKSTFDKINEELGLSEFSGECRIEVQGSTPRSGGLCVNTAFHEERIENQQLLDRVSAPSIRSTITQAGVTNPITEAAKRFIPQRPEIISKALAQHSKEELNEDERDILMPLRGLHFNDQLETLPDLISFDNFGQSLLNKEQVFGLYDKLKQTLPPSTSNTPKVLSPQVSPRLKRKTSTPGTNFEKDLARKQSLDGEYTSQILKAHFGQNKNMEPTKTMNPFNCFFFRPNASTNPAISEEDSSVMSSAPSATSSVAIRTIDSEVIPSSESSTMMSSAVNFSQDQQDSVAAAAAASAAMSSRRTRRPKPSRLREMNFWAPTSS